MPTAKKLPSGSWRCLAYSHTEKIFDEKSGIWKNKRIYESFTSDDPTKRGKHEAELAANQFLLTKRKDKQSTINITFLIIQTTPLLIFETLCIKTFCLI